LKEACIVLKDFIRQSLLEISDALREANEAYKKSHSFDRAAFILISGGNKKEGNGIHFDLAVTTKSETESGGKAGVNISIVELNTGGQSQQTEENVSRISFTVNISYYIG
jgi:hypothetical protein